jgi:hypothetical protein
VQALEHIGDRQWLHALVAVLVGLMLAGGGAWRSGPVAVASPLAPAAQAICRAASALAGGGAAIMSAGRR